MEPDLDDQPTTPGRSRADRRREGLLPVAEDPGRRRPAPPRPVPPAAARSGGPLRPVPARPGAAAQGPRTVEPARPRAGEPARTPEPAPLTRPRLPVPPSSAPPAASAPVHVGPSTTVAPFQAVPTPGYGEDPLDDEPPAAPERPSATAPAWAPAATPGQPAPDQPGYRDWTSPSGDERPVAPATEAIPDRTPARGRVAAPATEAIPDRTPARGRDDDSRDDDSRDDDSRDDRHHDHRAHDHHDDGDGRRPAAVPGPVTGPTTGFTTGVVGGRAALRAERQALDAERRKAARRAGVSASALRAADPESRPSGVRRAATGLLAVAVVALLVLGVYSFTAPDAREAARSQAAPATATPVASAPAVPSALPSLSVAPLPPVEEEAPAGPVRSPVTVLNATGINGLAADIAAALGTKGWESPGVGAYTGGDVAATTVYYTPGDATQQQAAEQLAQDFPQITTVATRFFEVPDVAAPGIVVVAAGDWRP
ncbi:LytR C-terminal domain-containing protein [Geodermatophilus sp. SYSU D00758]